MRLPETDNIHFQYAFKKGYRMAIDGKSVNSMPSDIRRDMELRQYYQEGWEQAVEDVTLAQQQANKPDWKHRFIWFAIMLVGGIATAAHIISRYENERAEQAAIINGTAEPNTPKPVLADTESSGNPLTLLTQSQRKDLQESQKQALQPIPLDDIVGSPIKIKRAIISQSIQQREPVTVFNQSVPKYIRELSFFTEIHQAEGQKVYHRWRTENQILATIELNIKENSFRTWSSKKMASAWQGRWHVEVLDQNKRVIYRYTFNYGSSE